MPETRRPNLVGSGVSTAFDTAKKVAAQRADETKDRYLKSPRRFWVPKDKKSKVIILDRGDKECGRAWEHSMYNPQTRKAGDPILCLKDSGSLCPLCESGDNSRFVVYFTVLDLSSYETKSGEKVEVSKKVLAITSASVLDQFKELFVQCGNDFRGVVLTMSRSNDSKSPNTGNPTLVISPKTQKMIRLSDKFLQEKYGNPADFVKGVALPKDYFLTAFNYNDVLTYMDADEMRRKLGISGYTPGSDSDSQLPWGDDSGDELEQALGETFDEAPGVEDALEEDVEETPPPKAKKKKEAAPVEEDEEEFDL